MLPSVNISTGLNSIFNPIISPLERSPQLQQQPTRQIDPRLVDKVDISDQGRKLSETEKSKVLNPKKANELSEDEKREFEKLKAADREVRAHERAHVAAGAGIIVSGANYSYEVGPDGKFYAVSGEVKIDMSEGKDPEATIVKMQRVKRAALAPAQPSSTDRSVASEAAQVEARARIELSKEKAVETSGQKYKSSNFSGENNGFISAYNRVSQTVGGNISLSV